MSCAILFYPWYTKLCHCLTQRCLISRPFQFETITFVLVFRHVNYQFMICLLFVFYIWSVPSSCVLLVVAPSSLVRPFIPFMLGTQSISGTPQKNAKHIYYLWLYSFKTMSRAHARKCFNILPAFWDSAYYSIWVSMSQLYFCQYIEDLYLGIHFQ